MFRSNTKIKVTAKAPIIPAVCREAEATLKFIEEITKTYNDPDVLVVGDLNAYTCEDPIRTLENGGLVNLLTTYAPNQYSYAYFSNGSYAVGYLDHSLATSTL